MNPQVLSRKSYFLRVTTLHTIISMDSEWDVIIMALLSIEERK